MELARNLREVQVASGALLRAKTAKTESSSDKIRLSHRKLHRMRSKAALDKPRQMYMFHHVRISIASMRTEWAQLAL